MILSASFSGRVILELYIVLGVRACESPDFLLRFIKFVIHNIKENSIFCFTFVRCYETYIFNLHNLCFIRSADVS